LIRAVCTLALVFVLGYATRAPAQDWNCEEPGNLPQQGMNMCAYEDWQRADRALNIAWGKVREHMKAIDASTRDYFPDQAVGEENLLKAQRAWIDYRDGHCEAEGAQFAGGSIQPLIINSCKASMTRKRTEELLLLMEVI
jgi:uncharacterized protein YecT (DUF1311 family)